MPRHQAFSYGHDEDFEETKVISNEILSGIYWSSTKEEF